MIVNKALYTLHMNIQSQIKCEAHVLAKKAMIDALVLRNKMASTYWELETELLGKQVALVNARNDALPRIYSTVDNMF